MKVLKKRIRQIKIALHNNESKDQGQKEIEAYVIVFQRLHETRNKTSIDMRNRDISKRDSNTLAIC